MHITYNIVHEKYVIIGAKNNTIIQFQSVPPQHFIIAYSIDNTGISNKLGIVIVYLVIAATLWIIKYNI
jgi:hypothetical protein